ncbi:MAG: protein translocase subunit SecD [Cyanobacteria bacterium]|nr:protein translocase subunit SecD [Cyanobacteriota bacterium]
MLDALNKNPKVTLLIVTVLIVGALITIFGAGTSIAKKEPRLGLDLKGGTRLTIEAIQSQDVPVINKRVMDTLYTIIDRRVNGMGISESIVQKSGDKRLIVEIPGVKDPDEAKRMLGQVGKLEFKRVINGQFVSSGVSGKDLSSADVTSDSSGGWAVSFKLKPEGADKFGKLTAELALRHEPLGIFFDDKQISAPTVQSPILNGDGIITGKFDRKEVQGLVDVLNAGALPVNIEFVEETTVGPLLGLTSIEQSLTAGLVGLGLVALFMVGYYRLQGLIAVMALLVYTLLTYAMFLQVGVTFTLAGIAGLILSIGMAVDANILIFERTKEEIRAGRSFLKAVDVGFDRAFPSIFDSNTTTIITCVLLWMLGTGSVKGFALTLAIGVLISMFSAITVTRTFLHLVTGSSDDKRGLGNFGMSTSESSS